jgi:hypothetical protein
MSESQDFPIDLFDYLIWISLATRETRGYVSRSQGRKLDKPATADVALEMMRAATISPREDPAVTAGAIASAHGAYCWAYHLDKPTDLLRRIAHAGVVREDDLGHAASMLSQCYQRRAPAQRRLTQMSFVPFWPSRERERAFDVDEGQAYFERDLRYVIGEKLTVFGWHGPHSGAFQLSVGVLEVEGLSTWARTRGEDAGTEMLKMLVGLIGDDANVLAAGRLGPSIIAVATDQVLRRELKRTFETISDPLTCGTDVRDEQTTSLTLYGGVTDFFDYPIRQIDQEQLAMDGSANAHAKPLLSNALTALCSARNDGDNRIGVYAADAKKPSNMHPRTPEKTQ